MPVQEPAGHAASSSSSRSENVNSLQAYGIGLGEGEPVYWSAGRGKGTQSGFDASARSQPTLSTRAPPHLRPHVASPAEQIAFQWLQEADLDHQHHGDL